VGERRLLLIKLGDWNFILSSVEWVKFAKKNIARLYHSQVGVISNPFNIPFNKKGHTYLSNQKPVGKIDPTSCPILILNLGDFSRNMIFVLQFSPRKIDVEHKPSAENLMMVGFRCESHVMEVIIGVGRWCDK
jgi:hypothetical protein